MIRSNDKPTFTLLNAFKSCSFAKSWCGVQYLNNQIDSCVIEAILIFDSHTYTKEKSNLVFRSEEFYKLKQIWSVSFNKFLTFFFTILSLFWLGSFHSYILLVGGWRRKCTTPLALEIHFLLTWKLVQRFTHKKTQIKHLKGRVYCPNIADVNVLLFTVMKQFLDFSKFLL